MLGCLELYYVLEQSFSSGLVVQNYYGIIELICAPLSKTTLTAYCDDVDAACRTSYNGPIEFHRLQKKWTHDPNFFWLVKTTKLMTSL